MNTTERLHARYRIETAYPLDVAAATMAGEQSTGTFVRVPGETDELRECYAAHIESIRELGFVDRPSLPGSGFPKGAAANPPRRGAEVELSWAVENMVPSLPDVLTTVVALHLKTRNMPCGPLCCT